MNYLTIIAIDLDDKVISDSEDGFNLWLKLGDDRYGEIKGEDEKFTETLNIKTDLHLSLFLDKY